MRRPVSTLIFDFDGTLTPLTIDFSYLRAEVEALAVKYMEEEAIKGLSHLYTVEMIYEVERILRETGREFRRAAFERMAEIETEASRGKELYPYAREVLVELKKKGLKVAIITRNCMGALKNIFPDMGEYVDSVVTRDDVARVKPHPDHVAAVLAALSATPDETVLVGDHPTDIAAGLAIGARTVGVLTGRTQRADFEKAGAHYIANDIRDVTRLL